MIDFATICSTNMEKLTKPERLSLDQNDLEGAKRWKHWVRTFENHIESIEQARQDGDPPINRLRILVNAVDFNEFDLIEDCATYEVAIQRLRSLYVKTPNAIFARHLLATTKQQQGQSLSEFMQCLHSLSKDCGFQAVTAEEYRRQSVRDAFINGLLSSSIRQRFLENRELDLDTAFTQASSLDLAQQHSQAYKYHRSSQMTAMTSNNAVETLSMDDNEISALSTKKKEMLLSWG